MPMLIIKPAGVERDPVPVHGRGVHSVAGVGGHDNIKSKHIRQQ